MKIRLLLALVRPNEGVVYFTDTMGRRYEASAATRDWLTYVPKRIITVFKNKAVNLGS